MPRKKEVQNGTEDGMLNLQIHKTEQVKSKAIEVKVE